MNGLDINSTPFKHEVSAVMEAGSVAPCYHFDLELHVGGENISVIGILSVTKKRDFLNDYYPVEAVEFQTTGYIREVLIENMDKIEVTFKTYEIAQQAPFSLANLKNPKVRRYKAKLYLAESDFISQDNFAVNNADYMQKKLMVVVKLQLVEKGFEELKTRFVGGPYRDVSGGELIRHLIDYHANLNNDDVNTLINGVDVAPNESRDKRDHIVIEDGTSLVQAMHVINEKCGGMYPAGFSYYIYNNVWYIFPPYSLNRFNEDSDRLIIVNLPKNRLPGIEKTFNDTTKTIIVLSTRDSTVKDKRESKRIEFGTGIRFADAAKLLNGFATAIGNRLNVNAEKNVNDLVVDHRSDGMNYMRFNNVKLTSAKNLELSRLAPSRGFMMRISWEHSREELIKPGMGCKVLYLKRNQAKSAVGCVVGVESVYYPYENTLPARKFAVQSYIDVFVSDEENEG